MKVATIFFNGVERVHMDGCRDVAREAKRLREPVYVLEVESRHEVNMHTWGDIASDQFDSDSAEWHAECDAAADMGGTVYLPCVAHLPQSKDAQVETIMALLEPLD